MKRWSDILTVLGLLLKLLWSLLVLAVALGILALCVWLIVGTVR